MSAALHLATPGDLDRLCTLAAAFQTEVGLSGTDEARRAALAPLLQGIPHGVAYLIGPPRAPMGYVIVTFGWSLEFGAVDGFVDEIYLRPAVRGRGIAGEILNSLPKALAEAGVKALHLEMPRPNDPAQRLFARAGFKTREGYVLMSKGL